MKEPTGELIFESLDNALSNGAFDEGEPLAGASTEQIADYMIAFDAYCGAFEAKDIITFVTQWMNKQDQEQRG